jgi:hemoglobin-like flavoprotein
VTPEQVAMVQASFTELGPRTPDLAARFYERLFEAAPACRTMFSEDPAVQEALFASELAAIARSISQFDAFTTRTRHLGARHRAYGVTYSHYETAGHVLLDALADTLGPAFGDDVRDAWRLAFDMMAETMMQGAADATPDSRMT